MANENHFSGKAQFYNSRPTYPKECINYLVNKFDLVANSVIADIGAGTGILPRRVLRVMPILRPMHGAMLPHDTQLRFHLFRLDADGH